MYNLFSQINVLMEILDPREKRKLDYSSFRTKIREALNVRIRTTRQNSFYESSVETLSVVVTAVNFVYVILTSQFQANWFDSYAFVVGALITSGVVVELVVRCNFMKMTYLPMTRLNAVFDILALIGAVVSLHGKFIPGY